VKRVNIGDIGEHFGGTAGTFGKTKEMRNIWKDTRQANKGHYWGTLRGHRSVGAAATAETSASKSFARQAVPSSAACLAKLFADASANLSMRDVVEEVALRGGL